MAAVAAIQVPSRWRTARVLGLIALLVLLIVEVVLAAPYIGRAVRSLGELNFAWFAVAMLAEFASMGAFARLQRRILGAGGTWVSVRRMLVLTYAANAVSVTLPVGTALSAGYSFRRMRRWGATVPLASFTLLATGALSLLAFGLLGLVAAVIVGADSMISVATGAGLAIVLGAAVLTHRLLRHPEQVTRIVSMLVGTSLRLLRRDPAAAQFRVQTLLSELTQIKLRRRDWLAGLGFAFANWAGDLLCLLAACRAVGAQASTLGLVTIAYLAGSSVSSLSMLPGGLGLVDAAMILALVHGGVGVVESTAAVLLYRLISLLLVVAIGWVLWFTTWAQDRRTGLSRRNPAPDALNLAGASAGRQGCEYI